MSKVVLALLAFIVASCVLGFCAADSHFADLLKITTSGGGHFHPHKNEIVFVSNKPGVLQLYTVRFSRKDPSKKFKPKRLTHTENRCTSPSYMRNGKIMFMHDRGGDEDFQIGIFNPERESITYVTHHLKAKNLLNKLTKKHMYYTSNFADKKRFGLYRKPYPITKSKPTLIYTPKNGMARLNLEVFHEKILILSQHYSNVHSELLWLNVATGKVSSLTKALSGLKPIRWTANRWLNKKRTRMLVHTDFESDFIRPAILELEYSSTNKLDAPKITFHAIPEIDAIGHDVTSAHFAPKTKFVYLEVNRDGYSVLIRTSLDENGIAKGASLDEIKLPLNNAVIAHGDSRSFGSGVSFSRDGKFAVLTLTNSKTPTTIYLCDLSDPSNLEPTGHQIVSVEGPRSIDANQFVGEKLRSFKSFDGLRVPYFLFTPKQSQSLKKPANGWPTIIDLHGGPESQSLPSFSPIRQFWLSAGYALAIPNIRGSKGYGRKYLDMDNQEKRLDAIHDIAELGKHLASVENIDASKLVVMGGSYGGYATLMALVEYPDMWKAGVDIVGMSNLETFLSHTAAWRRKLREPEYGYLTDHTLLHRISPIHYVDRIKAPLFMIMGANDERVPVEEAQQMYNKLRAKHQQVELLVFPDEGHGFSKLKNRIKAFTTLLTWLNTVLKNTNA